MKRVCDKIDSLSRKIDLLKYNPTLCSFCGKNRSEVKALIAGPVSMCVELIETDKAKEKKEVV